MCDKTPKCPSALTPPKGTFPNHQTPSPDLYTFVDKGPLPKVDEGSWEFFPTPTSILDVKGGAPSSGSRGRCSSRNPGPPSLLKRPTLEPHVTRL